MLLILLLAIFFMFITYVYVRWTQLKQYWSNRGIPYIPPHPIFGSFTFILRENCTLWFRRMYNYSKEPYVGIWIFWRSALLVNSPKIAKNILIKDQANFRNRLVTFGTTDPVGRLNLFTLKDPLWTVIRRRLTILFTGSKLRGIQNLVTDKSKQLIHRIEKDRQEPTCINLKSVMMDFTTDIIGTSSFGLVSDAVLTGTSHFKRITDSFIKVDFFRGLSWFCGFFIPELVGFFRFKLFPTECTGSMRKILQEAIAQRGGFGNKVTEPRDLLDILIKMKQESDEELEMTEDMILAQAVVFMHAGFDTTATAISFIIYELAYCFEVQEKLSKEIQESKAIHGDNLLDGSVLSRLTYLNCVVNEGLRKYPIVSWLDRIALEDYKVDDHLTIKAGTPICVNVAGLHYDSEFFPEPYIFNPDRFLPENKDDIKPLAYLPFGEGPRKCIGQRLGLSNVRHAVTAVILNYEVRPLPNIPKPSDVKLEKKTLVNAPEHILSVEFVPRNM